MITIFRCSDSRDMIDLLLSVYQKYEFKRLEWRGNWKSTLSESKEENVIVFEDWRRRHAEGGMAGWRGLFSLKQHAKGMAWTSLFAFPASQDFV